MNKLVNPKGILCECLSASLALSHDPVSAEVLILSCLELSSDIFELLCFSLTSAKDHCCRLNQKSLVMVDYLKIELENLQLNS